MNQIDYQEKQSRNHQNAFLQIVSPEFLSVYEDVRHRTMLSSEALYDLWLSTKYVCEKKLDGDILELGVWEGGALELVGHALNRYGGQNKIRGYDTFEGHPEPDSDEYDIWGNNMQESYLDHQSQEKDWAVASYEDVSNRVSHIYANTVLLKGVVDEKVNDEGIDGISILRLDMDWYKPTKIALNRFFGKIQRGGLLVVDDYGHHSGAKKALDEFLQENSLSLNLRHVNYSCVVANIV